MGAETSANRAYRHLRAKLMSGEFTPGSRLRYGPIGKEIGVSATPVREAAGQLANEGFLELVPQLGAVVRRIDAKELTEIYEVRLAIEPFAASLAAQRCTADQSNRIEAQLNRMRDLVARQRLAKSEYAGKRLMNQFDKADLAFHMEVIEASNNRSMVRTAGQSHVLTRVFGIRRHRYNSATMENTCREHDAILVAIQSSDSQAASQAAASHIKHGLNLSLAEMNDQPQ
ncbi:MAG: GntR family transcriptional regulator [Planctomycetota bacterium]